LQATRRDAGLPPPSTTGIRPDRLIAPTGIRPDRPSPTRGPDSGLFLRHRSDSSHMER